MVSRRPRMPRVPGAQHAQTQAARAQDEAAKAQEASAEARKAQEAAKGEGEAAKGRGTEDPKGEGRKAGAAKGREVEGSGVVELRRTADAADESVAEDTSRIVAERRVDRGAARTTGSEPGSRTAAKGREAAAKDRAPKQAATSAATGPGKPAARKGAAAAKAAAPKASAKTPATPARKGIAPASAAAKPPAQDRPQAEAEDVAPAAPAASSARIAREPDETVSTLHPGARPTGTSSRPGSRPAGPRAAGAAPQRRFGPGRSPAQAAQDAARRREPAPRPVPARSVTGRSLMVIAVIFIAATLMAPTLRVYLNQSLEIAAAEQDIQDQQRQKDEYEERIARWEDPDFVRQQARDRLDLVMPGETLYMVTGQDRLEEVPEEPAGPQEEPVNEHLPWAEGLWDSVVRAAIE